MKRDTDEEIEQRFQRVFHREMTLEERRCFFILDGRDRLIGNARTDDGAPPVAAVRRAS